MQQYIVRPNDTLFLIAREFKVPLEQLISANPQITNPDMIHVGQTIIIPDLMPIPNELLSIETDAEDIIENIYAGDWQSVRTRTDNIKTNMRDVLPQLQQAQVPGNVIAEINQAARNLEQHAMQERTFPAMSQANQTTRYVADALEYFKVVIPPDIHRLSYFARQIIINVEQNDWAEARNNYNRALAAWNRIKPELGAAYNEDIAYMDQVFADLNESINRRDYQAAIRNAIFILEAADIVGSIFFERNR